MKIAVTADWHAHQFTEGSRNIMVVWDEEFDRYVDVTDNLIEYPHAKEISSRFLNILNGLCDIRDYCNGNDIEELLVAGDIFHKRGTIDAVVFNAIYEVLHSFSYHEITVHIISGNHDQVDASTIPISAIHSFEKIAHIIEKPERFTIVDEGERVEIVALPYSKNKDFILESLQELRDECENPETAILMCHLGINGGTVGSGMCAMRDEYTLKELQSTHWAYLIAGHYHQPQRLDSNAIYPGTPIQNSFSDELKGKDAYNGFFVIDTKKSCEMEFIPIIAPRFITVSSAEELKQYDEEYIKNNFFRIKATAGDVEEIKDTLQEILGKEDTQEVRLELEKEYAVEQRSEIGITQTFDKVVQIYAQERCDDKDKLKQYTAMGLDILSEVTVGK